MNIITEHCFKSFDINKFVKLALIAAAITLMFSNSVISQETNEDKYKPVEISSPISGSRGYTGAFAKKAQAAAQDCQNICVGPFTTEILLREV
jgi:hypothetical protein